jgi:hypothetical protein
VIPRDVAYLHQQLQQAVRRITREITGSVPSITGKSRVIASGGHAEETWGVIPRAVAYLHQQLLQAVRKTRITRWITAKV